MKFAEKPLSENETLKNYQDKFTLKQDEESEFILPTIESHLATTDKDIVVGFEGQLILMPLKDFIDPGHRAPENPKIIRLPGAGVKNVFVLVHEKYIYAGSNGYVYRTDLKGNNLMINKLPDRGHHKINLAITDSSLVVGTYGYIVLVPLDDFENTKKNKNISLPGCGYEAVSVLVHNNYIYAGSNGYVYCLDLAGNSLLSNNLPERGYHAINLAITDHHLVVGTYGYVVLVPLDGFRDSGVNSNISLPDCGYENVSVLVSKNYIYAGSNGYAYRLNLDGTNILTNNLPGAGYAETRLTTFFDCLIVGTNGYVIEILLDYFEKTDKNVAINLNAGQSIVSLLNNREDDGLYVTCNYVINRINSTDEQNTLSSKPVNKTFPSLSQGK